MPEPLICLPLASPVSPSLTPGSAAARMMTAGSGRRLCALYGRYVPGGSSLKTCVAWLLSSSAWSSTRCWLTWKARAMRRNRWLFRLRPSMRGISATAFGFSPTPTNSMATMVDLFQAQGSSQTRPAYAEIAQWLRTPTATEDEGGTMAVRPGTTARIRIRDQIAAMMLPTLLAQDGKSGKVSEEVFTRNARPLREVIAMLPTPTVCGNSNRNGSSPTSGDGLATRVGAKTGLRLQPAFVALMMGYPERWGELPAYPPNPRQRKRKKRVMAANTGSDPSATPLSRRSRKCCSAPSDTQMTLKL